MTEPFGVVATVANGLVGLAAAAEYATGDHVAAIALGVLGLWMHQFMKPLTQKRPVQ